MDLNGIERSAAGLLNALARLITALRGGPLFEVEADYEAEVVPPRCPDCGKATDCAYPERLRVTVVATDTTRHRRLHKIGLCHPNLARRVWRHLKRRGPWPELDYEPLGGVDHPDWDRFMLKRFGEQRHLPTSVGIDAPWSCHLPLPPELPAGLQRGTEVRVWVGKRTGGRLCSNPVAIPVLEPPQPKPPQQCITCKTKASRSMRHHHHGQPQS